MSRKGLQIALNDLRDHTSDEYRRYILEVDDTTSIEAFSSPLLSMPKLYNEFVDVLVQRIVYTQVMSQVYNNPLKVLEGDDMPLGYLGQEIFVNPAVSRDYDIDDFAGALKKYESDVKVQYQEINFDKQYVVTVIRQKLKQAFVSWGKLEEFIVGMTNSLYNGLYIDEYNNTKAIVTRAYLSNAVQINVLNNPTDSDKAKAFVKKARELFLNFQTPTSDYNAWLKIGGYGRAIETFTKPEDIVFLIKNSIRAELDVDVLSTAFNMDKATLMGNILPVNDFDIYDRKTGNKILDGSKILGIICDKRWFRIKNEDIFMDDFKNANNRSINYYLNAIKCFNYSFFANAMVFATEQPTVAITALEFNQSSTDVNVGDIKTVRVIPSPLNATSPSTITYTSSDNTKATVEASDENPFECEITGIASGNVTITATAGNVSTTMTIEVKNVNITNMHFDNTSISAEVGTNEDVNLIVNPSNANYPTVVYTSSNSEVFTVEADTEDPHVAVVTPVGAGTAILTATAGSITTSATVVVTGQ